MRATDAVVPELKATGMPWRLVGGKKHIKVYLCNRLVGILPRKDVCSENGKRATLNVRAQIKRAARQLK